MAICSQIQRALNTMQRESSFVGPIKVEKALSAVSKIYFPNLKSLSKSPPESGAFVYCERP